jgi:hypothetical protein
MNLFILLWSRDVLMFKQVMVFFCFEKLFCLFYETNKLYFEKVTQVTPSKLWPALLFIGNLESNLALKRPFGSLKTHFHCTYGSLIYHKHHV